MKVGSYQSSLDALPIDNSIRITLICSTGFVLMCFRAIKNSAKL